MAPQLRRAISELFRSAVGARAARAAGPHLLPRHALPAAGAQRPRFDEWSGLHDLDSAGAQRLLQGEDASAEAFFSDTADFEARVQHEAAWLLKPEAQTDAEVHGPFLYFQRYTPEGFVVFCRSPIGDSQRVEVLLDTGALAEESKAGVAEVTVCKVSDDHEVMAYIVDLVGDESYQLCFKTLGDRAQNWSVRLDGVRSFEFLGGGSAEAGLDVLAVRMDAKTRRASQVIHHRVSRAGPIGEPQLLWHERNEAAYLEVFRTKDRQFVLLSSNTKDTSEVRVMRCNSSGDSMGPAEPQLLLPPRPGVEYFAEHHAGNFYVITNHERPDFVVYNLPVDKLGSPNGGWCDLTRFFTPPGGMHVTDADLFSRWLVLYGHEAAEPRICVVPLADGGSGSQGQPYLVELPSPVGSVEPGVNAEAGCDEVRYTFRSPLEPGATYSLRLSTGESTQVARREWHPQGGPGPEAFACERLELPARDGERVPLTLARPKDRGGGPRPCLLLLYGAYGTCLTPDFRPEHMVLMRRGWVIAWAHVRGGGERGREWHLGGRQLTKGRSVLDLADTVRFLLARGIAAPGRLCAKAASAGGLTLGAFVNSDEGASALAGAVLEVPFVDVVTGMSDPSLPLTVHEFAEWGDPREAVHEENMRSMSPYENVGPHPYPKLYLSCARADARVPAWMPLKLAARIRARAPKYLVDDRPQGARRRSAGTTARAADAEGPCVVLHCSDGGHGGAGDWHGRSEEFARQLAFLFKAASLPVA